MAIEIPLSKRGKHAGKHFAIVSDEDKDLLLINWTARPGKRTYYARHTLSSTPYRDESMHVLIAKRMFPEIPEGYEVDHIDGNGLNNQRTNLRLATRGQQRANSRRHQDSSTGFKGVTLHKPTGRYTAGIQYQKKFKRLGYFDTPEEAHAAYCEKAKELFGEFWNDGTTP